MKYAEAAEQMRDVEHYKRVYATDERHPCPVEGCRLSAEEHHRVTYGIVLENEQLRKRVKELESGGSS